MKIFVYGTLRTGGEFSRFLPKERKSVICKMTGLRMYSLKQFPGAIKTNDPDDYVIGELQEYNLPAKEEVELIELLDQIENIASGLFKRSSIPLPDGDKALIYEFSMLEVWERELRKTGTRPEIIHDWATVDWRVARGVQDLEHSGLKPRVKEKNNVALRKAEQKD